MAGKGKTEAPARSTKSKAGSKTAGGRKTRPASAAAKRGAKREAKPVARAGRTDTQSGAARGQAKSSAPARTERRSDGVAGQEARQAARDLHDTLTRWHKQMATAAEALAETCAHSADAAGAAQMAGLVAGQREMLAELKASLQKAQDVVDRYEQQLAVLAPAGSGAKDRQAADGALAVRPGDGHRELGVAGDDASAKAQSAAPSAFSKPRDVPLAAAGPVQDLMQDMAFAGFHVWAQAAQQGQQAWLQAMSLWVPFGCWPGEAAGQPRGDVRDGRKNGAGNGAGR